MPLIFALLVTTTLVLANETPLVPLPEGVPLSQELVIKPVEIVIPPQEQPVTITLPPKSCPKNFTNSINALEISARLPLLELMNASKRGDMILQTMPLLSVPNDLNGKDWGEIARLTRLIAQGNGVDPALYTTSIAGDILYRSTHELKAFTTQREVVGICAGVKPFTGFYRDKNTYLFQRRDLYEKLRGLVFVELKKEKPDLIFTLPDLLVRDIRLAFFDEVKLKKMEGRAAQFASLLAWLSEGQARVGGLAERLETLLSGIEKAHTIDCDCR